MAHRLRYEIKGPDWIFSLQRQAITPTPGTSANLGAAALVDVGKRDAVHLLAVRSTSSERLWASVSAPSRISVRIRLAESCAITDQPIVPFAGPEILHRFARIEGADHEGFDRSDGNPIHVTIGSDHLEIAILDAPDFDGRFGAPPEPAEPSVYDLRRLP